MVNMNVFRVLGDVSHTISKCILIWAIHANKSAEGVSLITQVLYAAVFSTRYLDLFWTPPALSMWNFILKIFYITSSFYIIFIMMRVYARTREREKAWKLGGICLAASVVLGPIFAKLSKYDFTFFEVAVAFSLILESVCIVPQLLLLRQTTVPTVIDSGYILTLGSYRAFYILNWIVRAAGEGPNPDWRAVLFGIIQTALYVDFAWVYWTRQRVKLRNGGVVDSDDLSRGFLVSRILGRGDTSGEDEERGLVEPTDNGTKASSGGKWGPRGISVSADDDLVAPKTTKSKASRTDSEDQDDDLAEIMDDDDSDNERFTAHHHSNGLTRGQQ